MSQDVGTITVVTYNLWGIFNSKHRAARMAHFASKVSRYDVLLLQEQFSEEDFNLIIQSLPQAVQESRHFRRFPTAFYGSGIAVISRFPISSALFYTYPLQGYPERVLHGDYFANKGVALVRVHVPVESPQSGDETYREVLLYSTHLVAMYEKTARLLDWRHELYLPVRLSQAICVADFVAETSKPTDFIVIAGDFNCSQKSLEVQTMLILLRRRGYQLDSVIPAASAAHFTSISADDRALLTFSHENVFNSTEEGWPVQGGDVPVQIDHMFISSNTLRLRPYEDCPDALPAHPFFAEVKGEKLPTGAVIFKANEVRVPARLSARAKFAGWLCAQGRKWSVGALEGLASWIAPASAATGEDSSVDMVPISDHYGVAARIDFCVDEGKKNVFERSPMVPLTDTEERVMQQSTLFLDQSVQKLNAGSRLCMICALLSATIVIGNILLIIYNAQGRHEYTGRLLEQLHTLSSLRATSTASTLLSQEDTRPGHSVMGWAQNIWRSTVGRHTQQLPPEGTSIAGDQVDYARVAERIHSVGILETIQPIVTIIGSVTCVGSLVIGLLQRKADSNCLAEQVRRLKREGF